MASREQPSADRPDPRDIIKVGGPIAGSLLSAIGSIIALVGFALPWASCGAYRLSGMDIASQSSTSGGSPATAVLLYLIPTLSLIILGIAIANIPLSIWKRIPRIIPALGTVAVTLAAALACLPAIGFFAQFQSARNSPSTLGMGGFFQIEYGFWATVFGLGLAICGGLAGAGASLLHVLRPRR